MRQLIAWFFTAAAVAVAQIQFLSRQQLSVLWRWTGCRSRWPNPILFLRRPPATLLGQPNVLPSAEISTDISLVSWPGPARPDHNEMIPPVGRTIVHMFVMIVNYFYTDEINICLLFLSLVAVCQLN